MQNVANATSGSAEAGDRKSLKEHARGELEKYVIMTVYLWLLFALFSLHRQLVQGHGVSAAGFRDRERPDFRQGYFDRPSA